MTYKIVSDSTANLTKIPGVDSAFVPLKIVTDEREFVDDSDLNQTEMLDYLSSYKGRSGTSCPSVGDWLEAFGDADCVFTVSITSGLSGSYNASVQAKADYEENHPGRRVCCLDSLSTGGEMALIIEKLTELIHAGKDFDTIEAEVRAYMETTHLLFCLESLNNLARNGRVPSVVAKACGLLGIRVIGKASDVGTLEPMHKARGEKKALTTIIKTMEDLDYKGGRVRINYCCNEAAAQGLMDLLKAAYPEADITCCPTGGLCSFYAERGGLIIGFEG